MRKYNNSKYAALLHLAGITEEVPSRAGREQSGRPKEFALPKPFIVDDYRLAECQEKIVNDVTNWIIDSVKPRTEFAEIRRTQGTRIGIIRLPLGVG